MAASQYLFSFLWDTDIIRTLKQTSDPTFLSEINGINFGANLTKIGQK